MANYTELKAHLKDDSRIAELKAIEAKLENHPFPPQLIIENTSQCNMQCIHCSHREMKREKNNMSRELWNKIVEEVAKESPHCEIWPTFYGEALLLKDELWDRLDYAAQVGCKNIVLNSNGMLLEKNDNIEKVLKSPLKRFILSLDGFKPETFEKIRKNGKWNKIYPAVEELCAKRRERNLKYPLLIAQFSVMKENAAEVQDYVKYWKERGAEVKIRPMLEWGSVGSVRTDTIIHEDNFRIACPWGINTAAIHQNGDMVACAVDYEGKYKSGNVLNNSIKEIWDKMGRDFRKVHFEHQWDKLPSLCQKCCDWQVAGAQYEEEVIEDTRPFWFKEKNN